MVPVIIVVVIITAVLLAGIWISKMRSKKHKNNTRNNNGNFSSRQRAEKERMNRGANRQTTFFETQSQIWFSNSQKVIPIKKYNYSEIATDFPFFTNFNESEKFLHDKKISAQRQVEAKRALNKIQKEFNKSFNNALAGLFNYFNRTSARMDDNVLRYFNQYYGYFLNVNHELLERYLYNTTVSHVIEQALGKGLIGDDGYIRAALNSYTQSINGAVNEIAQRIQQDQAEQNQQFFDDLFRQFREAFEQSTNGSYSYRSSESHGYYEEKVNGKTVLQAAYTTLQVEESATDDEVKKAYRKLAKEYHPDRNPSKEAKDKMAAVNNAYDTVKKSRNMK